MSCPPFSAVVAVCIGRGAQVVLLKVSLPLLPFVQKMLVFPAKVVWRKVALGAERPTSSAGKIVSRGRVS